MIVNNFFTGTPTFQCGKYQRNCFKERTIDEGIGNFVKNRKLVNINFKIEHKKTDIAAN